VEEVAVVDTSAVEADTSAGEVRILGAVPASEVEPGILPAAHASAVAPRVLIPEVSAFHHSGRASLK